jgi:hypothetical protein
VFVIGFLYVSYHYINPVLLFRENHLEFQRIQKKVIVWENISHIEKKPFRLEHLLKIYSHGEEKPLILSNKFFHLEEIEQVLKEKGYIIHE